MKVSVLFITLLYVVAANSNSIRQKPFEWVKRAVDLGIESGELLFEWSLTDDCEIENVTIIEASPEGLFDDAALAEITSRVVGPFEWGRDMFDERRPDLFDIVIDTSNISGIEITKVETTKRDMRSKRIHWTLTPPYLSIVCFSTMDGNFHHAEYVGGGDATEIIVLELSKLGASQHKVTFLRDLDDTY